MISEHRHKCDSRDQQKLALASRSVGRPLTPAEVAAALRRGAEIEQLLSLGGGEVRYLIAYRRSGEYVMSRHVVYDDGTEVFQDISEFTPIDEEEYVGEGVTVGSFGEPGEAVEAAASHGGVADRWVNQGMAAADYWRAKQGG